MDTLNVPIKYRTVFQSFTTNCTLEKYFGIICTIVHSYNGIIYRLITDGGNLCGLRVLAGHF